MGVCIPMQKGRLLPVPSVDEFYFTKNWFSAVKLESFLKWQREIEMESV